MKKTMYDAPVRLVQNRLSRLIRTTELNQW